MLAKIVTGIVATIFSLPAHSANKCPGYLDPAAAVANAIAKDPNSTFAQQFAPFVLRQKPNKDNFDSIAQNAFIERLKWSTQNDKKFIDDYGQKWKFRVAGTPGFGKYSSIGGPYMLGLERFFDGILPVAIARDFEMCAPMQIKFFASPIDQVLGKPYFFIGKRSEETLPDREYRIVVAHASSQDIPKIRDYMRGLWRKILDRRRSIANRLETLAGFEWIYYGASPKKNSIDRSNCTVKLYTRITTLKVGSSDVNFRRGSWQSYS